MKVENKLNLVRILLISAAAALILIGIARGDVTEVLKKAIGICFECIGIG